ncbi:MAG: Bax inhibitor-1/YccA family protein [Chitinophagales bacterium]
MEPLDQNMQSQFSLDRVLAEQQDFITKVYGWMSLALVITGITAYLTATSQAVLEFIFGIPYMFMGLLIGEVLLVIGLSAMINKMSAATATFLFVLYSVVNGLTLSVIFLVYTQGSISLTFFVTALTFGVMSAYGYFTKKDLTSWGNLLMMALVGLVISSIFNLFMKNEILYWITTYAGILIFVGLTAYDTQKIKNMNMIGADGETARKGAIMGALTLYLDFINLFLLLLRLLGRRK